MNQTGFKNGDQQLDQVSSVSVGWHVGLGYLFLDEWLLKGVIGNTIHAKGDISTAAISIGYVF